MQKMNGQDTTLWWVEGDAVGWVTPPATISKAVWDTAVTAGTIHNLTDAIEKGYTLNMTDSDTDDSSTVATVGNGVTRGAYNYEADISGFREDDPTTNTDSEFEEFFQLFRAKGERGYWVQRLGRPYTDLLTVGDVVSVYQFETDYPRNTKSDSGGPYYLQAKFGQQGFALPHKTVVA
jgi:hypothetical protein